MKFSLRTAVLSLRAIHLAIAVVGALFWLWAAAIAPLIGIVLLLLWLSTTYLLRNTYLILRTTDQIMERVVRTLDLMDVAYQLSNRTVVVEPTGTTLHVTAVASVGFLHFRITGAHPKQESYLRRVILKFLNQS